MFPASGGGATTKLLMDYDSNVASDILDFMFKPGFGLDLDILKTEMGGDTDSTEGAEPSHMHSGLCARCTPACMQTPDLVLWMLCRRPLHDHTMINGPWPQMHDVLNLHVICIVPSMEFNDYTTLLCHRPLGCQLPPRLRMVAHEGSKGTQTRHQTLRPALGVSWLARSNSKFNHTG